MILNSDEQSIWALHKDFFYPDGISNEDAFNAYLQKYAQLGQLQGYARYPRYPQQQLLGVILKHAPDAAFKAAFQCYYSQFRTGASSAEFDAWLGDVSIARPAVLAEALRYISPELNFTQQVMVLRDVQKWFPAHNIKKYAAPKLLKTKPNVILKQFNPMLVDMPHLLAMGAALIKNEDPQCKALGDTIVRGSFIARYGMPPESEEGTYVASMQRSTVKYCSTDAFAMLLRHGLKMDPGSLLQQVQLRYNAQSVIFDALAYPVQVLENEQSSQEEKTDALAVFNEVMIFSESHPNHLGFINVVESALARLHAVVPLEEQRVRIENHLVSHMENLSGNKLEYSNARYDVSVVLSTVRLSNPALMPILVKHLFDSIDANEKLQFIRNATDNADYGEHKYPVNIGCADVDTKKSCFNLLPENQVEEFVLGTLRYCFESCTSAYDQTPYLKDVLDCFAHFDWSESKATVFRRSPLAATTILSYLYLNAIGHADAVEPMQEHGTPYMQWTPLPFLKKMYPEQTELWNSMTIGLLQMPIADTEEEKQHQYQKVMASMFNAFSKAFLVDGPSLGIAQGIIESLGASPLDYFIDAHKTISSALELTLPENMFSFN